MRLTAMEIIEVYMDGCSSVSIGVSQEFQKWLLSLVDEDEAFRVFMEVQNVIEIWCHENNIDNVLYKCGQLMHMNMESFNHIVYAIEGKVQSNLAHTGDDFVTQLFHDNSGVYVTLETTTPNLVRKFMTQGEK